MRRVGLTEGINFGKRLIPFPIFKILCLPATTEIQSLDSRTKKPFDHQSWQTARDYVLSRQRTENGVARYQHLSKIAEVKAAKQREHEREIDAELLPTKLRLKRDWLANNPTFSEIEFETKAWHLLKENLLEERETDAANAEIQRQLASGRY
jgi:hypothetical protein